MSRHIDADALMKSIRNIRDMQNFKSDTNWYSAYDEFLDLIEDFPTADVVEVIRCKDCKFWQTDWLTSHDGYHYCAMVDIIIDGDFYCKDGERKILPKD